MLQEIAQKSPKEIIIQAIYSKLIGLQESDSQNEITSDYSNEDLDTSLSRYIYHFGQPPGLNSVEDFKILRREFAVGLRHKNSPSELCFEVAKQALDKGIPYATNGISPAARMLKDMIKEVIVEVNRAKSLTFNAHPEDHSIYWADYHIRHNTADVILKHFAKRHPMKTVLIYSRREVFWIKNNQIYCQDLSDFSLANVDPKHHMPSYYRAAH